MLRASLCVLAAVGLFWPLAAAGLAAAGRWACAGEHYFHLRQVWGRDRPAVALPLLAATLAVVGSGLGRGRAARAGCHLLAGLVVAGVAAAHVFTDRWWYSA